MEPEDLWSWVQWQTLNIGHKLRMLDHGWCIIELTLGVLIILLKCLLRNITLEYSGNQPDILIISDPPTIVNLRSQVIKHLKGNRLILIKQHLELPLTHTQILIGEFVGDVPADGSELPSVLDDGVEEAESEEQFAELHAFFAGVELVLADVGVGTQQVGAQALWGFDCHLYAVLEHGNWEGLRGHRG
jgi:hypothetical protein